MTSRPVYTSKAEGFRTAEEIAAMRPIADPKPRAPRKPGNPALRQVTNGIACFCGERFGESQALEFMLHLRAEVGGELAWAADKRRRMRESYHRYIRQPESHERRLQYEAERRQRPSRRERKREYDRKRAADPVIRERRLKQKREYEAKRRQDPARRERQREYERQYRARKKAGREAAST